MKNQFYITIVLLISLISGAYATAVCTDNPAWGQFKSWATADANTDLTAGISDYEKNTPAVVADLSFCKQFNGQSTCCTAQLVAGMKKLIVAKTVKHQNKKLIFGQITNRLQKIAAKCDSAKGASAPTDLDSNKGPKAQYVTEYKKCYAKIIRAAARFQRGNVCSICVDPAKIADFFDADTSKLKVESTSFQSYLDETKSGFDCLNGLYTQFNSIVNEFFATYTDGTKTGCKQAKEKINAYLTNNPLCANNDCTATIASKIKLFGDGPEAAPVQDDSAADSAIGSTALRRSLVAATYTSFIPVSTGGVTAYITADDDANIQFDGINPDYVYVPPTSSSSSSVLYFTIISIIALIVMIL